MPDNDLREDAEKRDLVITRVFDAPVERLWKAWSDAEDVLRWWGPRGFSCPSAVMDFRTGGASLVCMRAPKEFGGGDTYNTWTYTEIVPLETIEYMLHFVDQAGTRVDPSALGLPPDMPVEMRNLVTFTDLGDGRTELSITEFDWPVGQMREMSELGMKQCLDKMAGVVAG